MSPARKIALTLSRVGFRVLLVTTITLGTLYLSYGTAQQIKYSLTEAKAYTRFLDGVIQSNVDADQTSIFADAKVAEITKAAFTPKLLQETTEKFIDRWYDWLNGKASKPAYTFNFTPQRQQLAEQLSIYAMDRMASLPTCTAFEAELSLDPFRATCQPAGLVYRDEQLSLQAQLLESESFFPKVVYTEADLPKAQSGKPISEELAYAPLIFQTMPYILIALILALILFAAVTIALRSVRRNGWHELGKNLLGSGIFLAISAVVFGLLVPQMTRSFQSQFIGNGTDRLIGDIVRNLTVGFESIFINISLQVAALGAVILVALKVIRPTSRYKGLEHITGIVNGLRPTIDTLTAKRSIGAPVVTSERQRKPHVRAKRRRSKKSRISKEIA